MVTTASPQPHHRQLAFRSMQMLDAFKSRKASVPLSQTFGFLDSREESLRTTSEKIKFQHIFNSCDRLEINFERNSQFRSDC
jgi:hypothetical protein